MCLQWEFLNSMPQFVLHESEFPVPLTPGALSLPRVWQEMQIIKIKSNSSLFIYLFIYSFIYFIFPVWPFLEL